eukprot:11162695-Lingulodinium_polyedra.AAC.1
MPGPRPLLFCSGPTAVRCVRFCTPPWSRSSNYLVARSRGRPIEVAFNGLRSLSGSVAAMSEDASR